jgi:hypothetical protein
VHPFACFFNHNCLPNCIRHSVGRDFYFTTLYPVPKNSELTITYIGGKSDKGKPIKKPRSYFSKIPALSARVNLFRIDFRLKFVYVAKYLPLTYKHKTMKIRSTLLLVNLIVLFLSSGRASQKKARDFKQQLLLRVQLFQMLQKKRIS